MNDSVCESECQQKASTFESKLSVTYVFSPVALLYTQRRLRSASYPSRAMLCHAMYLPSGENCGLVSYPGLFFRFSSLFTACPFMERVGSTATGL